MWMKARDAQFALLAKKRDARKRFKRRSAMSIAAETHTKSEAPRASVKDALRHAHEAAQELHGALSAAAARRGGASQDDLEAIPLKTKQIVDAIKGALAAQDASTRRSLGEAVTYLDGAAKHAAAAVKSSGLVAEHLVQRAIADARASVQKLSQVFAEKQKGGELH